jgi:hypothetical protein
VEKRHSGKHQKRRYKLARGPDKVKECSSSPLADSGDLARISELRPSQDRTGGHEYDHKNRK